MTIALTPLLLRLLLLVTAATGDCYSYGPAVAAFASAPKNLVKMQPTAVARTATTTTTTLSDYFVLLFPKFLLLH